MISALELLTILRPLHICIGKTGHIYQVGSSIVKLGVGDLCGRRFLEVFEVLRPARPGTIAEIALLAGQVIKLQLRSQPDISFRGLLVDDGEGGVVLDLSFGIAVVDAVQRFGLTAQDFAAGDLAVELLFLQEAKSSAMAASFSLNSRLNGARLVAETKALTDGLTGLHNRRALDAALSRLDQSDTKYAVLHMDLDRFKTVNDTMGHAVGDAVLKRVASIMRSHTRQDDVLVRMGGDEFVILCPGLTDAVRLQDLSLSLIQEVSAPMTVESLDVQIGASIGIAVSSSSPRMAGAELVDCADVALYRAKRSGRGQYAVWSPAMGRRLTDLDPSGVAASG
jgi:diguanylate cyclase (GGDEF)-like protein